MRRQLSISLGLAVVLLGCGRADYDALPPSQDGALADASIHGADAALMDGVDGAVIDGGSMVAPPSWPPVCGDGILQAPIEECEPGTASDDGYCASNCRPCGSSTQPGFYWETTGSCYWLNPSPSSWSSSRDACRARGGGDLVVYETEEEWAAVRDRISPATPSFIGLYYYYAWLWIDSRPLSNPHWSEEPISPNSHSRAVQSADGSWQMVDVFLGATRPAVCEREARDGWILGTGELQGHAYLLIRETVSWEFARLRCESYGAHLLTIGSVEEDFFLSSAGLFAHNHSWIGLHDRDSEGDMTWVTGEPVTYVGSIGDTNRDVSDCVARGATQWHWRVCDTLFPFICEIDPPS